MECPADGVGVMLASITSALKNEAADVTQPRVAEQGDAGWFILLKDFLNSSAT